MGEVVEGKNRDTFNDEPGKGDDKPMQALPGFDPEWTLPSRTEDNPLVWMVQSNGLPADIRHAPRHLQEIAFDKGLILYIPADRRGGEGAMAKRSDETDPLNGRWRIVSMGQWDQDYVDEEEEGYFEFDDKGRGEFHFGYVNGRMDCRPTTREGEPAVEWSWEGNDETDPAQGRGWAVRKGEELRGMIFFHQGDESAFVAKKTQAQEGPKRK